MSHAITFLVIDGDESDELWLAYRDHTYVASVSRSVIEQLPHQDIVAVGYCSVPVLVDATPAVQFRTATWHRFIDTTLARFQRGEFDSLLGDRNQDE